MMKLLPLVCVVTVLFAGTPAAFAVRMEPSEMNMQRKLNPKAVLRQEKHMQRLTRVEGMVHGLSQKLDNLDQRLSRQLVNIERRLVALKGAGHTLTVDEEIEALRNATKVARDHIAEIKEMLAALPDSDTPREQGKAAHELLKTLRTDLRKVQESRQTLQQAVRKDVESSPMMSPTPTL